MTAKTDSLSWKAPSWQTEQLYNNHVLIGNWNEEQRKFERGRSYFNSTHRTDFKNYGYFKPETSIRRRCVIANDGVGKCFIFAHHGNAYANNTISWYDQQFNNRENNESSLPKLRTWDAKTLAYCPEKSDYPLQGPPTNFGLYQQLQEKWKKQKELENVGDYVTTYTSSFIRRPRNGSQARSLKSTPQRLSSKLHPHQVNRDLHLREFQKNTTPEGQPVLTM